MDFYHTQVNRVNIHCKGNTHTEIMQMHTHRHTQTNTDTHTNTHAHTQKYRNIETQKHVGYSSSVHGNGWVEWSQTRECIKEGLRFLSHTG